MSDKDNDKKDTAWFETQVIDNDSLSFRQKLKLFWEYCLKEAKRMMNE